jgi:hypothetical protein
MSPSGGWPRSGLDDPVEGSPGEMAYNSPSCVLSEGYPGPHPREPILIVKTGKVLSVGNG